MRKERWFVSSSGSKDLALTIKGFLIALVPLFIIAGKYYGFEPLEGEIVAWIEALTGGVAAVVVGVGVLRKIANRF